MRTDNKRIGLEGIRHGMRYQDGVTEHPGGARSRAEYGTLSATAWECGCGVSTGY